MDAGGGGISGDGGAVDDTIVRRLLLKFRPIAPKPVCRQSLAGSSGMDELRNVPAAGKVKLQKRKYVRRRESNINKTSTRRRKKEDRSPEEEKGGRNEAEEEWPENMKTFRLLPGKAEEERQVDEILVGRDKPRSIIDSMQSSILGTPRRCYNLNNHSAGTLAPFSLHGSDQVPMGQASGFLFDHRPSEGSSILGDLDRRLLFQPPDRPAMMQESGLLGLRLVALVETVTVDCLTNTDPGELGGSDTEIIKNLDLDSSPGFISDSSNRVRWVNGAFRRMMTAVADGQSWPPPLPVESAVVLEARGKLPEWSRAFSGQVRVKLRREHQRDRGTVEKLSERGGCKWQQVVPCDVWRMDFGGFAWRLDLGAALTLGRLSWKSSSSTDQLSSQQTTFALPGSGTIFFPLSLILLFYFYFFFQICHIF